MQNSDAGLCFFLLTGLFEAGLHPLREPAQVTVTVQGVSAESPADTHTHTLLQVESTTLKHTHIQIHGAALTGGTER